MHRGPAPWSAERASTCGRRAADVRPTCGRQGGWGAGGWAACRRPKAVTAAPSTAVTSPGAARAPRDCNGSALRHCPTRALPYEDGTPALGRGAMWAGELHSLVPTSPFGLTVRWLALAGCGPAIPCPGEQVGQDDGETVETGAACWHGKAHPGSRYVPFRRKQPIAGRDQRREPFGSELFVAAGVRVRGAHRGRERAAHLRRSRARVQSQQIPGVHPSIVPFHRRARCGVSSTQQAETAPMDADLPDCRQTDASGRSSPTGAPWSGTAGCSAGRPPRRCCVGGRRSSPTARWRTTRLQRRSISRSDDLSWPSSANGQANSVVS